MAGARDAAAPFSLVSRADRLRAAEVEFFGIGPELTTPEANAKKEKRQWLALYHQMDEANVRDELRELKTELAELKRLMSGRTGDDAVPPMAVEPEVN